MINPNTVLNQDNFEIIKHSSICSICKGILLNPFICNKCQIPFCKSCINESIKSTAKCPSGCKKIEISESRSHRNMLDILDFACKNKCGASIKYENWIEHYTRTCPNWNNNNNNTHRNKHPLNNSNNEANTEELNGKWNYFNTKINNLYKEIETLQNKEAEKNHWISTYQQRLHYWEQSKPQRDSNKRKAFQYYSKSHEHPLVFLLVNCRGYRYWKCNCCWRSYSSTQKSYYCTCCDYDLCEECKWNQEGDEGDEGVDIGEISWNINWNKTNIRKNLVGNYDDFR